jgi:DNA-binding Xre family transcriptional regulator
VRCYKPVSNIPQMTQVTKVTLITYGTHGSNIVTCGMLMAVCLLSCCPGDIVELTGKVLQNC